MLLALGVLACVGLWWLGRSGRPFRWKFATGTIRRAGAWGALALAATLLLRGQIVPALILGLAGAWLLEGPEKPMLRLRRLFQARRTEPRRHRTALVEFVLAGDGSVADGSALGGPLSGRPFGGLAQPDLVAILAVCRGHDPAAIVPLESYLDRRHPGWRIDAERDADPGPRRPAQPGAMTTEEAYQVLGLERGATPEAVRAAHRALMKEAHPDQGGSAEHAARVNAARDRLTNRHR